MPSSPTIARSPTASASGISSPIPISSLGGRQHCLGIERYPLVCRSVAAHASRNRRDRQYERATAAVSHAGSMGQPPQSGFSRFRRTDYPRPDATGRCRARAALRQDLDCLANRHAGRGSSSGRRRTIGHVTLADELDCSRGDVLAAAEDSPEIADQFEATLVWMADEPIAARPPLLAEARNATRHRDHPRPQISGQRQYPGTPRRQDAEPQCHRHSESVHRQALGV